jgi:glycosyltransferase involved in cell wall biosynthesis
VCDGKRGPSATQRISFDQPFRSGGSPAVRVRFESDYPDQEGLSRAFAVQPPDLLVLSRYTSARGGDWIGLARSAGIPVIFHIDDDLLAVPTSLGHAKHSAYNSAERLKALRDNIDSSDLCYVSTPALAERFRDHGVRPPIVAGNVYCSVSPDCIGALIGPATGPVIGYMGTSGHAADLAMILPAICEVLDAVPELQFELFGTIEMPTELARFGRRIRHLPPVADYSDFIPQLRSLGWWVGLAPLEDNVFNRCKADTKWVEYSLAGFATVASDLPVYHRACSGGAGILVDGPAGWRDAILRLIHRPALRESVIAAAQERLREQYTHDSLRRQVLDIFDQAFALVGAGTSIRRPLPDPAFADEPPRSGH